MPSPVNGSPAVSVVVVNYNGADHLAEGLAALAACEPNLPVEILVVDNASTDSSLTLAEQFATTCPAVRILKSPVNRGYAGGVNLALGHVRGRYVAALNADMIVTPGWLTPAVAFLDARPEVGAINPLIVLYDDEQRINAAGQDVHVTGLGFNRWLGQPRRRAGARPLAVAGVQGGAVITRRALLEAMGGWDERGFLYHEDVELSWLLRLMGYELYCLPEIAVRHKYRLSMYAEKLFLLERNRLRMLATHLEPASLIVMSPVLLLTEFFMWAYCCLRGRRFMQAKAASYVWVAGQRGEIAERRRLIRSLRRRSDWQVLSKLRWAYAWDQLRTLGTEQGVASREPAGGLPIQTGEPT
jgi:GT2 family glycosyltransferase